MSKLVPDEGIEPPTFGLQNPQNDGLFLPKMWAAYEEMFGETDACADEALRSTRANPPPGDAEDRDETRHSGEPE